MSGTQALPRSLRLYRKATRASAPALNALLAWRLRQGKEDALRLDERRGRAARARPQGPVTWIHAVSVGEANSVLPLIEGLRRLRPDMAIVLTTGTLTSARLMAQRLSDPFVIHQFAPLDHPLWAAQFLDHWRPDLGLIVESELWPNLLLTASARAIPLVLLNARLSPRSHRNWSLAKDAAQTLLSVFTLCLAQDKGSAARLSDLGARNIHVPGNLKFAAAPLPDNQAARAAFESALGRRPCWLAASTHPHEEDDVGAAHRLVMREFPGALAIVAPRHPERGEGIAAALSLKGLRVARRAKGDPLTAQTDIYLADTLGELGIFYRIAPIVFMGGTLAQKGGQNPLEPARLGCALLHGPYTDNFTELFAALDEAGAATRVDGAPALSGAVRAQLADPAGCAAKGSAARMVAGSAGDVLARILDALTPHLPAPQDTGHARA